MHKDDGSSAVCAPIRHVEANWDAVKLQVLRLETQWYFLCSKLKGRYSCKTLFDWNRTETGFKTLYICWGRIFRNRIRIHEIMKTPQGVSIKFKLAHNEGQVSVETTYNLFYQFTIHEKIYGKYTWALTTAITLLTVMYKLTERIRLASAKEWIARKDIKMMFTGSRTNILAFIHACYCRDRSTTVYVTFLDIRKAFDTVWIERVLYKLNNLAWVVKYGT